jgi:hypothetical protein
MTGARRAEGVTARFQPLTGRRTDTTQISGTQQALIDLEQLAVEFTWRGHHGWADRTRDAARRLS